MAQSFIPGFQKSWSNAGYDCLFFMPSSVPVSSLKEGSVISVMSPGLLLLWIGNQLLLLAAVRARVTSQLGHCSAALRAVPLLNEAGTIQFSVSPLPSSLETLQPLDQVFFLQEVFPPFPLAYKKHIQFFFRSSDFGWKRRRWILHLAIDIFCISQTATTTVSSPGMHRGIPLGPCLKQVYRKCLAVMLWSLLCKGLFLTLFLMQRLKHPGL